MTYLMENSNPHRPVAASEDLVDNLPREVLQVDCTGFPSLYRISGLNISQQLPYSVKTVQSAKNNFPLSLTILTSWSS